LFKTPLCGVFLSDAYPHCPEKNRLKALLRQISFDIMTVFMAKRVRID